MSPDRVRPVEDDHGFPGLMAGLHAEFHCPDEGIVAAANVLQVDDERVDIREHFGPGLASVPIKAVDRQAACSVAKAFPLPHVVLGLSEDAVLRAEERCEAEFF